jgi:hypothetical protein
MSFSSKYGEEDGVTYGGVYNAGILLDKQLDQDIHSTFFLRLSRICINMKYQMP